jgi:hypothetical protein
MSKSLKDRQRSIEELSSNSLTEKALTKGGDLLLGMSSAKETFDKMKEGAQKLLGDSNPILMQTMVTSLECH